MVPIFSGLNEIHWIAIALRGCVAIVKVGGSARQCKSDFTLAYLRQRVIPAHQNRLSVSRIIGRPRRDTVKSPRPTAYVVRRIRVIYPTKLGLADLIEFLWQKLLVTLMRFWVGWRIQCGHRLFDRHHIERRYKRPRRRARPGD